MQAEQSAIFAKPPVEHPNIIGNAEDYELMSQAAVSALPDSDGDEFGGSNNLGVDLSSFKDI